MLTEDVPTNLTRVQTVLTVKYGAALSQDSVPASNSIHGTYINANQTNPNITVTYVGSSHVCTGHEHHPVRRHPVVRKRTTATRPHRYHL